MKQYANLSQATCAALDALVAKHPVCCGRDLLGRAAKAARQTQPDLGDPSEVDMYIFLKHRPECGVDCDDECPVTGEPADN